VKIATFNANSVRQRLPIILDWLAEQEPDVLAIQETKVVDEKFPLSDFEDIGYCVVMHGQKSTSGVAIASRQPLRNVKIGLGDPLFPDDARVISGELDGVTIVNTYVPNGTAVGTDKFDYKLKWLARFRQYLSERFRPSDNLVWLGDINIAPKPEDIYNSRRFYGGVGHHPLEFRALDEIINWGLVDCFRKFTKGPGHYTYWDYVIPNSLERNLGWRIDHIYATIPLADKCLKCVVDKEPRRMEKPSDHTPVWAEFEP
jgi:exodeoxyribonuclease-3